MYYTIAITLVTIQSYIHSHRVDGIDDQIACDGLIFHDVYYDKKALISNLGTPCNLVMHKFSRVLFFSHTIKSVTQVDFGIMACYLQEDQCVDVKNIKGGYAVAYDIVNDDIYMGGEDGIYKYNFMTKSAEFFGEEGKSIWGIFIRNNFYYIDYPSQKLYVLHDDGFVQVAEAAKIEIDHFFVSKLNDIYFSNSSALFKVPYNTKKRIILSDEIQVRQIAEDGYGDVYFCASDGIYLENKPFDSIKKIADIEHAFGLTFDVEDRAIFSNKDSIYKLEPSEYTNECYEAMNTLNKDKKASLKQIL